MYMLAKGNYIKSKRGIYEVLELIRRGALWDLNMYKN
jgi:hypothetical protein